MDDDDDLLPQEPGFGLNETNIVLLDEYGDIMEPKAPEPSDFLLLAKLCRKERLLCRKPNAGHVWTFVFPDGCLTIRPNPVALLRLLITVNNFGQFYGDKWLRELHMMCINIAELDWARRTGQPAIWAPAEYRQKKEANRWNSELMTFVIDFVRQDPSQVLRDMRERLDTLEIGISHLSGRVSMLESSSARPRLTLVS